MSMAIDGEKIAAIYIVRNPDKLRHLPAAGDALTRSAERPRGSNNSSRP